MILSIYFYIDATSEIQRGPAGPTYTGTGRVPGDCARAAYSALCADLGVKPECDEVGYVEIPNGWRWDIEQTESVALKAAATR